MIRQIEGFDKYVAIAGFINTQINDADRLLNLAREKLDNKEIQFFDAKLVAGWKHLYFAILNAMTAFKNGTSISKNLAVECLLYASAQRQIKAAVNLIGIKRGLSQIAVVAITADRKSAEKVLEEVSQLVYGKHDDNVLELTDEKLVRVRALFRISDAELSSKIVEDDEKKALSNLVLEHVALLATQR